MIIKSIRSIFCFTGLIFDRDEDGKMSESFDLLKTCRWREHQKRTASHGKGSSKEIKTFVLLSISVVEKINKEDTVTDLYLFYDFFSVL